MGEEAVEENWILEQRMEDGSEVIHQLAERITVGRKPSNTIQIRDTKASGVNTEIVADGAGYTVRDLNSTNGTRVDGKLVTEDVSLYHGSVITVGKTDFIIKNTAIPDIGEPGFESQQLGGENFTAFARRRRRLPVGLILFLFLAAAGLVAFPYFAEKTVRQEDKTLSTPGNLLVENYSFEGGADAEGIPLGYCTAVLGENDTVAILRGSSTTGKACLEITKGEGAAPEAEIEVLYSAPLDVSSNALYELRADLRPQDVQGVVGLRITWLKKKDPLYRRASTSTLLSGDMDWQQVKLLARPPENVTGMEVSVLFTGSAGTLLCDDMALFKTSGDAPGATLEGKKLTLTFDEHGVFSVRPVGILKDVIWNGQIVVIGREGKSKSQQMFSAVDEGYPKTTDGKVEIRGRIFEFLSRTWIPFTQTAVVEKGELRIEYVIEPPAGVIDLAGLVFSPDLARVVQGVGIATDDEYAEVTGTFERDSVTRMIWGRGGGRISFNYEPSVTCLQKRKAKELVFLQIVTPDEKGAFRFSLHFQTDFSEAATAVVDLLDKGQTNRREGKLGAAVKAYQAIVSRFPFHRDAKKAISGIKEIEAKADEERSKLRARFTNAKFFSDLGEMRALRDDAAVLCERYAGCGIAEGFTGLAKEISLAYADLKLSLGRDRVEGLLMRARDYLDRDERHLAQAILGYIVAEYEASEWAKTAQEELARIKDR